MAIPPVLPDYHAGRFVGFVTLWNRLIRKKVQGLSRRERPWTSMPAVGVDAPPFMGLLYAVLPLRKPDVFGRFLDDIVAVSFLIRGSTEVPTGSRIFRAKEGKSVLDTVGSLVPVLVGLAIFIVLFLVFRAFVLWYWKVDRLVLLLEELVLLQGGNLETLGTAAHRDEAEKQAFYRRHQNEVDDPLFWLRLEEQTAREKGEVWRGSRDWERFQENRRGRVSDEQYQAAKESIRQP